MLPLRRMTSDLRELRWGQVLVELVLLIVGILIALAVNGWIEDRRDAQTERQYLEGIVRDLDRDLTVLKEFAAYHQGQVADGVMAYRALRTEPDVKDKEGVALPNALKNIGVDFEQRKLLLHPFGLREHEAHILEMLGDAAFGAELAADHLRTFDVHDLRIGGRAARDGRDAGL